MRITAAGSALLRTVPLNSDADATAAPTGSTIAAPTSAPKRPAAKTTAARTTDSQEGDGRSFVAGFPSGGPRVSAAPTATGTITANSASSSFPIP